MLRPETLDPKISLRQVPLIYLAMAMVVLAVLARRLGVTRLRCPSGGALPHAAATARDDAFPRPSLSAGAPARPLQQSTAGASADVQVGGGAAVGGGETRSNAPAGDREVGRPCESPDAAFRDLMLSRLAALEGEVAELRSLTAGRSGAASGSGEAGSNDAGGVGARGASPNPHVHPIHVERETKQESNPHQQKQQHERRQHRGEGAGADSNAGKGAAGCADSDEAEAEAATKVDGEGSGSATEAVAEGLSRLHPKITRLVHSGYLESLHHLRQRLMVDEWEGGGRQRALRRGVADLEAQCREKELPLGWDELTQLYKHPENLDVIRDPNMRGVARSTLQRVLDDRHEKVREGATQLAKELADGVTHGPGNLISGLWGLLPLPSFLKGGK